jgi:hypothetical protein
VPDVRLLAFGRRDVLGVLSVVASVMSPVYSPPRGRLRAEAGHLGQQS